MITFRERLTLIGTVTVTAVDASGRVVDVWRGRNIITDAGLDLIIATLREEAPDSPRLLELSWGDNNTAPAAADVALGNETGRQAVSRREAGATGVTITTTYLAPATAVGQIEELGWWAGDTLWARVLYSRNKVATEALQVARTDTLARA